MPKVNIAVSYAYFSHKNSIRCSGVDGNDSIFRKCCRSSLTKPSTVYQAKRSSYHSETYLSSRGMNSTSNHLLAKAARLLIMSSNPKFCLNTRWCTIANPSNISHLIRSFKGVRLRTRGRKAVCCGRNPLPKGECCACVPLD